MNEAIVSLVEQLASGDCKSREESILFLGMLIEKECSRYPDRKLYRLILPPSLLDLQFNAADKAMLLEMLGERLFNESIPMTVRTVLLIVLGKCCSLTVFPHMLKFFRDFADSFDDENAYNAVVAITPSYFAPDQNEEVRRQLEYHGTLGTLEKLELRRSERLNEPLGRLILSVRRILNR